MLELPDIRKQKGYKQDDMALALKMPQSYLSYQGKGLPVLAGKHCPQADRNQEKGNPAKV